MTSRYWAVSLPVQNSASSVWNSLQEQISKHSFDTPLYRFNIPNLRVGTLDSLLSLSDDLVRSNSFIEGVSQKTRRQIDELERVSGVDSNALTVDGVPVDSYLTRFVWDEAKYPTMSPLKEIVDSIHTQVAKIEDDLKVRVAEYNNVRSQLNAINRKQSGSLAVRDLSNLVKPEDIIISENLITLLAIIPKYSQKDWLASYETLTSYVVRCVSFRMLQSVVPSLSLIHLASVFQVPRSSKKLYEDNEYALYTVTLFRRVADNFRTSSREKGFQIRDFEYSSEAQENRKQEIERIVQDQESLRSSLLQWCYTSYGEVIFFIPLGQCNACVIWFGFFVGGRLSYANLQLIKTCVSAGFQLLDAFLCCSCLCREHSKIWIATIILGEYSSYVFHEIPMKHLFFPKHWLLGPFQACVLSPSLKSEKKVRSVLDGLGDSSNRQHVLENRRRSSGRDNRIGRRCRYSFLCVHHNQSCLNHTCSSFLLMENSKSEDSFCSF
ncbi:hypothetical protein SADUNF_Sadunf17G0057600 [Salix dunnii]|uniref:V-type proton ATPase subunit C n=1 Tax=Salix dunnii TaxID=1413687 RepID=A0A835J635_9ROSI|nr:hypothetical protein SADUNF_Sadunf17G0057600 [Salix dunnii]